ncbi:MAG: hypothetical protein HQL44_03145 [Alphaproteobacteria bacterium]|nr:hypothetical protein [Alphaproteobacteria bacterium]
MNLNKLPRILFLAPGAVALIAGLLAGLDRMDIALPIPTIDLAMKHGPLMVAGFLATVIGLERAVALQSGWAFLAPAFSGIGALLFLAGFSQAPILMALGGLVLALSGLEGVRRQPALYSVIMALGGMAGAAATVFWAFGASVPDAVGSWMAFLALTIAGERLELTRFLPPAKGRTPSLILLIALILLGSATSLIDSNAAPRVMGAGFLGLAVWLMVFDIARRNLRQPGLPRFIGLALLLGYVWLGIGGGALIDHGMPQGGFEYDAVLHLIFVGFVFSMIFGHAPVILPAVLKVQTPYHPILMVWLALLHGGLLLRLIGDHNAIVALRQWGGVLNEAAIILLIVTLAFRTIRAKRRPQST